MSESLSNLDEIKTRLDAEHLSDRASIFVPFCDFDQLELFIRICSRSHLDAESMASAASSVHKSSDSESFDAGSKNSLKINASSCNANISPISLTVVSSCDIIKMVSSIFDLGFNVEISLFFLTTQEEYKPYHRKIRVLSAQFEDQTFNIVLLKIWNYANSPKQLNFADLDAFESDMDELDSCPGYTWYNFHSQ